MSGDPSLKSSLESSSSLSPSIIVDCLLKRCFGLFAFKVSYEISIRVFCFLKSYKVALTAST